MLHYHVIKNTPGYMPWADEPPYAFATFDAAKRDLIEELARDEDAYAMGDDEDMAEACSHAAQDVNLWSGPDVAYVSTDRPHDLGVAYSVIECQERECIEDEDNSDIAWPEPMKNTSEGWICSDCLQLIANGETPPEMDEDETAAYMELVSSGQEGCQSPYITLGRLAGLHGCGEPHAWDDEAHSTYCEVIDFSWSRCDLCRRPGQAGERHAATFWLAPTDVDA